MKLAAVIDWEVFERERAGFLPSSKGRAATEPRLVAGLLYFQHAYRLSDEAVVARWVENPYAQYLTGEDFFQHRLPVDSSSLTRWRSRIGEEAVDCLLTQTIRTGQRVAENSQPQSGPSSQQANADGHAAVQQPPHDQHAHFHPP